MLYLSIYSERTVFIMPPEPVGLPEGAKYRYVELLQRVIG